MRPKALLIDLDGTIYLGKKRIEGAREFIDFLRQQEINFLFVTNNAMRSPKQVVEFLKTYHDISVQPSEVYTSVDSVLYKLKKDLNKISHPKAYAIGSNYLRQEVYALMEETSPDHDTTTDVVVMGLDLDLTYGQLSWASRYVQRGATFYLTNPDLRLPDEQGFIPGAGTMGQVVETTSQTPPIMTGKPQATFIEGALNRLSLSPDEIMIMGDGLATDIQAAKNIGSPSIFMETGVNKREDLKGTGLKPTWIIHDYEELMIKCKNEWHI